MHEAAAEGHAGRAEHARGRYGQTPRACDCLAGPGAARGALRPSTDLPPSPCADRRETTVADIDKEIKEMQGMLSEMQREIDKQANKRTQADMRSMQQKKQKELKVATQNFDRIKLGMTKDAGGPRGETSRDRMLRLKQVQDNTNARVNRIERSLGETEEVGANTLDRMENQTNRYARVNDQLKDAAGQIDVAGATNRRLWRGQALDKCIYCFTILVLIGGLGALVYIKLIK
jgi:hypothetical protein